MYNVEDSCQIMHHCQSRNQADAETIFTINYLLITKFWEAFSYLPLSEELISGDQIWLDGKNRIAQLKGSIINNLFRFEARKHTSLPQHSMARCGWWLVAQFLVPQTPLLFCEAAQHSQFIIYAECIIFPSRCSWQLLSNINTPVVLPGWAGAGGDVLRSPSIMQLCGTSEKFIKSQKVLIKLMHFFISISTWAFVIIHDLIGNISGAVTRACDKCHIFLDSPFHLL